MDGPSAGVETALAHVIQKKVEAVYRGTDLFEWRRRLMHDWAVYLARESRASEIGSGH